MFSMASMIRPGSVWGPQQLSEPRDGASDEPDNTVDTVNTVLHGHEDSRIYDLKPRVVLLSLGVRRWR